MASWRSDCVAGNVYDLFRLRLSGFVLCILLLKSYTLTRRKGPTVKNLAQVSARADPGSCRVQDTSSSSGALRVAHPG